MRPLLKRELAAAAGLCFAKPNTGLCRVGRDVKKLLGVIAIVILGAGVWWVLRPSAFDTGAPLRSDGTPVDLLSDLDTDTLPQGWVHRTFMTAAAAEYQIVDTQGDRALRCTTDNSGSILARDMQIALTSLPILTWEWRITQPIVSEIDEATKDGDDHPARFFVVFSNEEGALKAMEIIWSNRKYAPGEYKIIDDFYHYVANGLDENTGVWHGQTVNLRQIYADIGGTGTPTLEVLGFFCDSDNTGAQSEAMFRNVILTPATN